MNFCKINQECFKIKFKIKASLKVKNLYNRINLYKKDLINKELKTLKGLRII